MQMLAGSLGTAVLAYASYTDLRWRVIRNWAVGGAAAGGLVLGAAVHGLPGLLTGVEGIAAGAAWWVAVTYAGLGAGDAKLAMAIGAILGPTAAFAGPAVGHMLCALGLIPWIVWRRVRRLPWRHMAVPMAPWIAAGTALVALFRFA